MQREEKGDSAGSQPRGRPLLVRSVSEQETAVHISATGVDSTSGGSPTQRGNSGALQPDQQTAEDGRTRTTSALRRHRRQRAANPAAKAAMGRSGRQAAKGDALAKAPVPSGKSRMAPGISKALQQQQCAKLAEDLRAGGAALAPAVASLRGRVLPLAFDGAGCRVVQMALEATNRTIAAELAAELQGHVCDAIRSPHANYVIQKLIEVLPIAQVAFVQEELSGKGQEVARHRYGCRIICRLLEHSATETGPMKLIDEVLLGVGGLCRHAFGHYVIQSILEHGTPEHRHTIAVSLHTELVRGKPNRNACYVIENAMSYCSAEDRLVLAEGLLSGGSDHLAALAQHQHGSHVVRALLRTPGDGSELAKGQLNVAAAMLQATRYGRRLVDDFGLGEASAART